MERTTHRGLAFGKPLSKYNLAQVLQGMLVESEHTGVIGGVKKYFSKTLPIDPIMAMDISKDHLEEFPTYYTYLTEMEVRMERERHVR
jgi:hypothetical protein